MKFFRLLNLMFVNYYCSIISLTVNSPPSSMYLAVNIRGDVGVERLTYLSIANRVNRLIRIVLPHTWLFAKEETLLNAPFVKATCRRRVIMSFDVISDSSLILVIRVRALRVQTGASFENNNPISGKSGWNIRPLSQRLK